MEIPKAVLEKVSFDYLLTFRLLPLQWTGQHLKLGVAKLQPFYPIDNLSLALDSSSVEVVLMDAKEIEQTLRKWMESDIAKPQGLIQDARTKLDGHGAVYAGEDLLREVSTAPVVRMINAVLLEAIQERVTDVHFHPKADGLSVLYRRDGMLHEVHTIPLELREGAISRLKVMAKLDVTQRIVPQDGRFSMKSAEKEIEVRVSVVPTIQGERIALRFLDRENLLIRADELGMDPADYARLLLLMKRPNGMILVTGPTGSGKTTTLYSFISELDRSEKNVMTIEDPVEYKIEGITQMQVKPALGLSFAQGLRSLLRQDPDVILVGEIRDRETAEISIRAALTGHLVLATLHTTDAPGAIERLLDIGIEPYLISSALMCVVSQRLVRRLCEKCHGHKCPSCFLTGFRGRTGIFELLTMDDDFRRLTSQRVDIQALRRQMQEQNVPDLKMAGAAKVKQGLTCEEEVLRVVG